MTTIPETFTFGLISSWLVLAVYLVLAKVIYEVVLAIYNLYLSPLRHFPRYAPAAATFWYETYWDVFRDHSYIWRIQEMHKELDSPVIRTNPRDVHIHDPDFFDELYTPHGIRPGDKWEWWTKGFAVPKAGGMTIEHEVHRKRRGALNPFFSKASIVANQPIIQDKCSYGWTYNYVHDPDWAMTWKLVNTGGRASAAIVRSFPLIGRIVRAMPLQLAIKLVPPVGFMKSWMQRVGIQVKKIKADAETMAMIKMEKRRKDTIFAQILSSDLPEAELSDERLIDEGVLIATAGSETTAWAITITTYHVMRNPAVLAKLRTELQAVAPSVRAGEAVADWTILEKLPYLTAIIKEGTRMAGGMLSRLPRIYDKPILYKQWVIPAGTPVAMTPHLVLIDEAVFPEPRRFDPDRWLDRVDQGVTTSSLDKYIVAFGKGSRNCIGMHLAYAQLYMCVAAVCDRFDLDMYQTDDTDATPTRDLFTAGTKLDRIKPKKNGKGYAAQRDVVAWRCREEGLSDVENDGGTSGRRSASLRPGSALYDNQNVNQENSATVDDCSGNPYKFDTPDAVGDFVRERRRKRRRLIAEECMWNDGLRNWIRQRDAWTGAVERKEPLQAGGETKAQKPQQQQQQKGKSRTLHTRNESGGTMDSVPFSHSSEASHEPLAPDAIIYSKVVIQSLTPNIPIPLTHMTKILVEGWKSEGNWPPADTQSAATATATAAAAASKSARSARFLRWKRERAAARDARYTPMTGTAAAAADDGKGGTSGRRERVRKSISFAVKRGLGLGLDGHSHSHNHNPSSKAGAAEADNKAESVFERKSKDGKDMDVGIEFREHSGNEEDGEQETAEEEREASRIY
ncbi:hypothetical protein DV736_g6378, partial [Chaetothyriales sp. CBS 134916]